MASVLYQFGKRNYLCNRVLTWFFLVDFSLKVLFSFFVFFFLSFIRICFFPYSRRGSSRGSSKRSSGRSVIASSVSSSVDGRKLKDCASPRGSQREKRRVPVDSSGLAARTTSPRSSMGAGSSGSKSAAQQLMLQQQQQQQQLSHSRGGVPSGGMMGAAQNGGTWPRYIMSPPDSTTGGTCV